MTTLISCIHRKYFEQLGPSQGYSHSQKWIYILNILGLWYNLIPQTHFIMVVDLKKIK